MIIKMVNEAVRCKCNNPTFEDRNVNEKYKVCLDCGKIYVNEELEE